MEEYFLNHECSIKEALVKLDKLNGDGVLFIIEKGNILLGSLTDGDIRRGLLKGLKIEDLAIKVANLNPKYFLEKSIDTTSIALFREKKFKIVPIVNKQNQIIQILNFKKNKSYLPLDVVIMAGGKGERLRPLTDKTPKPLLKVADKPIIEHIFERLLYFGVKDFTISINYLGDQIKDFFSTKEIEDVSVQFVEEKIPLGTIGSVSLIEKFNNDYVLLTNSDLLTNLDYENLYQAFIKSNSDMAIVSIPYEVKIPYAVLEITNGLVSSLVEKPQYIYHSNAGIYLFKKSVLKKIPYNTFYNATDLVEEVIKCGGNIFNYSLNDLWIDIGTHSDFEKANNILNNNL